MAPVAGLSADLADGRVSHRSKDAGAGSQLFRYLEDGCDRGKVLKCLASGRVDLFPLAGSKFADRRPSTIRASGRIY
jgi:hypothetical protein